MICMEEHMSLDGHWSVKIFDFMVFLYESRISCAFSLAFNMVLTLTLIDDSLSQRKRKNHQQQLGSIKY